MLALGKILKRLSAPLEAVLGRLRPEALELTGGREPNAGGGALEGGLEPEPKGGVPTVPPGTVRGLVGDEVLIGLNPPPKGCSCRVCVPAPMPGARLRRRLAATTSSIAASGSSVISSGAAPSELP